MRHLVLQEGQIPMRKKFLSRKALWVTVADGEQGGGGDSGEQEQQEPTVEGAQERGGDDLGFPKNTSTEDMTADQRAAYWRHESKKQERIAAEEKAAAKKLQADLDAIEREKLSEQDRAVADARAEGRTEAVRETSAVIAAYELRLRGMSAEDASALVEVLDLSKLTREDGTVDADRLDSFAKGSVSGRRGSQADSFGGAPNNTKGLASLSPQSVADRAEEIKSSFIGGKR